MKGKGIRKLLLICFGLLFALELVLRYYFGFCDAVLMKNDKDFEYIAQENQDRFRFRKRIIYNSYSMRNSEIKKNAGKILGFGDSVINGGTLTDQDSLATEQLSFALSRIYDTAVQVLNISAGSWGPDNCAAYLKKYGDFGARVVFLVVSSHDAHDNMTFQPVVGKNISYPNRQHSFAIQELICRYLIPKIFGAQTEEPYSIQKGGDGTAFNSGFKDIAEFCKKNKIPFFIYLHPEKSELKNRKYNLQGEEIIQFAKKEDIPLYKELEMGIRLTDYRDDIHLNEGGQNNLYQNLFKSVIDFQLRNKSSLWKFRKAN